ncbi:unnamed protein product [Bursaphelenchus okinawaensis]|uniref:Peptidase A1 domain-containing protein n=1 Tax=Bursaphelenchus okinawaensis TaxID=465554 RepID=A0A811K1C2_9BILA|nr:unnamed protein product [Bursaphelenchus okinawaensis]CAG9089652.1 unnamed protein product [Bursaphelenchus okinawaensis]
MLLRWVICLTTLKLVPAIELKIIDDYFYTINVTIGSPPQNFTLALDITASNTVVYGNSTALDSLPSNERVFYEPYKSDTALKLFHIPANQSYSGTLTSLIKYDTLVYADAFSINGEPFGIIRFVVVQNYDYGTYSYLPTNGLVGIGADILHHGLGLMSNILHLKNASVVSLYTPRDTQNENAHITFGPGAPHVNCEPQRNWTFFDSYDHTNRINKLFEMKYTFTKYGNTSVKLSKYSYFALSTLTSYVTVHKFMFKTIKSELNSTSVVARGSTIEVVDCKWKTTAPNITLGNEDMQFDIPSEDYIVETEPNYCILKVRENVAAANRRWVLGVTFLKSYCVQFDLSGQKVGFVSSNMP